MKELPRPLGRALLSIMVEERFPAFLRLDQHGHLRDWGGDLQHYGLKDLARGEDALQRLTLLQGLFPLKDQHLWLPRISLALGRTIDLCLAADAKGYWVLLLEAGPEELKYRQMQQKYNDLMLKRKNSQRDSTGLLDSS